MHESFRSSNVLFWTAHSISQNPKDLEADLEAKLDYSQPWVLGFDFSRPEFGFSSGFKDICKERDIYRHPERQGLPNKRFTKIHDIYSLGMHVSLQQSGTRLSMKRRLLTPFRHCFTRNWNMVHCTHHRRNRHWRRTQPP